MCIHVFLEEGSQDELSLDLIIRIQLASINIQIKAPCQVREGVTGWGHPSHRVNIGVDEN